MDEKTTAHKYYIDKARPRETIVRDLWVIRKTRFKGQAPHPHDVIAAGTPDDLKRMAKKYNFDVDWSLLI